MTAEDLALAGVDWVLAQARPAGDGLAWSRDVEDRELSPTLYGGTAGIVLCLLEAHAHTGDPRTADAARAGARWLAAEATGIPPSGLFLGLTGVAVALDLVGVALDDPTLRAAGRRALDEVARRFDGERWGAQIELLAGNAGIALGALALGDAGLAVDACEPYLRLAEPTGYGVRWEGRRGLTSRFHHVSHGTLGIALALVEVGTATGRGDLTALGLAGAADVVARDEAGPAGFAVPHSDPQDARAPRWSYGWCHGPTGDAGAFARIGALTGDPGWDRLADRCWATVTDSGLPARLRPGFWDNQGCCCGTAGVLALATRRGDGVFGEHLVADFAARVTSAGCWSNVDHTADPPTLPPATGWAMGTAGISRELLAWSRTTSGLDSYALRWPHE